MHQQQLDKKLYPNSKKDKRTYYQCSMLYNRFPKRVIALCISEQVEEGRFISVASPRGPISTVV